MATESGSLPQSETRGIAYSVARSLVTPYWPYTVYVMAYVTFAVALASIPGTFDVLVYGGLMVAIYAGLEGLHALDLADDGVAIDLDKNATYLTGAIEVLVGVAAATYVALNSTLLFVPLIIAGTFFGLAYNLEWFDGLFHDRDKITGLAGFALSWGTIPFLAGYITIHQEIGLGVLLVALGISLDAVRVNYLEGHGRIARYELTGIQHDRTHKSSGDEARRACNRANIINLGAWAAIAAGMAVMFAL